MRKDILLLCCLTFLLSLFTFHCANPVTPEGGAKDTQPPKVTECTPGNYSTHFTAKSIRITFDEFIALKSSGSEIMISPPLDQSPDYKLRGKSVLVDFDDTLARNTTYIINFGKAISDITENNIFTDFNYVFSTGSYLDSMTLTGHVVSAFDNQPQPDVYALLYTDSYDTIPFDSLPYLVKPRYSARTDQQGNFTFLNLKYDAYKLFILNDQTGELKFNMPGEKIAFCDSLVYPWTVVKQPVDSLESDSVPEPNTLIHMPLLLRIFEEIDSTQKITKSEFVKQDLLLLVFKYPARKPVFTPLNMDRTSLWCLEEFTRNNDSVMLWITAKIPDTLFLKITENGTILDTLKLTEKKPQVKKNKKEEENPESLTLAWSPRGGTFNQYKYDLTGTFSYPISTYSLSAIKVIKDKDTLSPAVSFTDSIYRSIRIRFNWKEGKSYTVWMPDSVFVSFNGLSHDTLRYFCTTALARDLGSLLLNVDISQNPGNYIIQLQTEKGKTVEEQYLIATRKVKFAFIPPGKYMIKAILDSNGNKRWDTGNYLKRLQPEQVFYFPKTIELRGNWDLEEEWRIGR
ncbi:MAG: Ig-like domain-containing protein [bacterium]